jgi:uncharacterized protein (AIM24 family)
MDSLAHFLETTAGRGGARFANESSQILRIELEGGVWLKPGAALAWHGQARFERRPTIGASSIGDAVVREFAPLVHVSGSAYLYCGDHRSDVTIIRLADETIVVSSAHVLAFEESLAFEAMLVGHGIGFAAGGLATLTLSGQGYLALTTHGHPLTLPVTPGSSMTTDPHATIAWSPELIPTLRTDLTWRAFVHHGGQETVRMQFAGSGFVVIQPRADRSRINLSVRPLRRFLSLVTG